MEQCEGCGLDREPDAPHDCLAELRAAIASLLRSNESLTFQLQLCRLALNEEGEH